MPNSALLEAQGAGWASGAGQRSYNPPMKEKVELPVVLTTTQRDYLERMTSAHGLPDLSKAIRILVSYAMATPEQEASIFEVVRCASPQECDNAPGTDES